MIRKIARPMLASVYVIDGVETLLNPAGHKESAESVLKKVRAMTPREYRNFLPKDAETAAKIVGQVDGWGCALHGNRFLGLELSNTFPPPGHDPCSGQAATAWQLSAQQRQAFSQTCLS